MGQDGIEWNEAENLGEGSIRYRWREVTWGNDTAGPQIKIQWPGKNNAKNDPGRQQGYCPQSHVDGIAGLWGEEVGICHVFGVLKFTHPERGVRCWVWGYGTIM